VASYPIDGDLAIAPLDCIDLQFDRPMDWDALDAAVSVMPPMDWERSVLDTAYTVCLKATSWQPGTAYQVAVGVGAAAADGATLEVPLALHFAIGGKGAPIPVLMYHHFAELGADATQGQRDWTVSPKALAEQLDYLQEHGYHSISPTQLANYLGDGQPLPPKPVMITIDDGYQEVVDAALPLFLKTDLRPVLFIITDYVGYGAYMDWPVLISLAEQGFVIGSHGMSHSNLQQATEDELQREVAGSKSIIEEKLGKPVDAFCYPYGGLKKHTKEVVAASGYRTGYSLNPTIYQDRADPFFIGRSRIDYDTTMEDFIALLPD